MEGITPQQIKKVERIAKVVAEGELALAEYLFEIEEKIEAEIPEIKNIMARLRGEKGEEGKDGKNGVDGKDGKIGVDGINGKDGKDGKNGRDGSDGSDGKDGNDGMPGKDGKDGSPDTPEQVLEKVQSLNGEEGLQIKDIYKLPEALEALKRQPSTQHIVPSGLNREHFKDMDISAQLDGVTKTFNIPAVWNILTVDLSSFPNTLRKGVDYTYTPTSITFTSEIDAASSLAAGQTCILTVVLA